MSITIDRTSTTLTEHDDMSTTMRMDGHDLVVTVLDSLGIEVGTWNTRTLKVHSGDTYMGKADNIDTAADLMTAPEGAEKTRKASKPRATARPTQKEHAMTATRPTLASTNARIDLLAESVEALTRSLKVYLDGDAPIKLTSKSAKSSEPASRAEVQCKGTTASGERCTRTGAKRCFQHKGQKRATVTPAPKATKGSRTDLARRDFNRTVTTKARLAGGDTYSRVIAGWADVKAMHAEGLTPDQVIARFTK